MISRGFEELLYELAPKPGREARRFDVVIVGSGYGGAVAAAELAGCRESEGEREISVCVLERGREYLPGMFPSRLAELAGHVRFSTAGAARARGNREGLFDVRIGPDLCAVLGNGLGGGSLINAGVMEIPDEAVFDARWPDEFRDARKRAALYERARREVGALDDQGPNTIARHAPGVPPKYRALQGLAGASAVRPAEITVAMEDKCTAAGAALKACIGCGDCATGCNHGAKESLDINLLATAWRRGAELYTGATVLRVAPDEHAGEGWVLSVVHTDEKLRRREGRPLELRARKVILAAGAFGTPEILLRSQSDRLQLSRRLGQGFSANGDMLATVYGQKVEVNAVADEAIAPAARGIGPTITGVARTGSHVIEELAVPAALGRAFEELATTGCMLHSLRKPARRSGSSDPCAVDPQAIRRSSVLAIIGRDDADGMGSLELAGRDDPDGGDGALGVRWPELRKHPLFGSQIAALESLADGTVLPNPLWQLLPRRMQEIFGLENGPLLTVHPLGGCSMGRTPEEGVVDPLGRVFKRRIDSPLDEGPGPIERFGDLAVLDGSMIPCALGTNPALTITALALHATSKLREAWGYRRSSGYRRALPQRSVHRVSAPVPAARPTEIEIVERMSGPARLRMPDGTALECVVELTLPFQSCTIASLVRPGQAPAKLLRSLQLPQEDGGRRGELRVFGKEKWRSWQLLGGREEDMAAIGDIVEARATLQGTLSFLHRPPNESPCSQWRAFLAWAVNRGARDAWQEWRSGALRRKARGGGFLRMACEHLHDAWTLASHAAEVRLLEYDLRIDEVASDRLGVLSKGASVRGAKQLTYGRRANPWLQLTRMTLSAFPCLDGKARPVLELDGKYLARENVPLLRLVAQENAPNALADLASLGGWLARVIVGIHLWSFRRPDAPVPREPQRLPGIVRGLPEPTIREIEVDRLPSGAPVNVRLTRYRPAKPVRAPVVLIHGYSASGTTFAHHAVRPNLAEYLCKRGRDVWILDLRTSSGMPTARHPWSFEDAALADLPAAFAHVREQTGHVKLDVVAHCMGSAMFSMAVLKPPAPGERYYREREALPTWIRRAVLSQVGPVVMMSPGNIFRAYLLTYLRNYLPLAGYDFRVKDDPGPLDQLIDRLLATIPYPDQEYDLENPPLAFWRRTPFAGTRHRMDALYGRDFSLADKDGRPLLSKAALEYIDDLFGPLSVDTVAQGLHLARLQTVAANYGRNVYVTLENVRGRWKFPTLSVHGEDNGLADVATLHRMEAIMGGFGADIRTAVFAGFGHQDSLIGTRADRVFASMAKFLEEGR